MNCFGRNISVGTLGLLLCLLTTFLVDASAQDSEATRLLKARSAEFDEAVIEVAEGVYTAVGYSVSTSTMIEGEDGVIIVDTTIDIAGAERVYEAFRKITDKPIVAIIYTHAHGDHIGGARVFAKDNPVVWARSSFGSEGSPMTAAGLSIQNVRGARQAGFKLPPEQRINNGVAKVYYPKQGGAAFHGADGEGVLPTHTFDEGRVKFRAAGLDVELVAVNGETQDGLYVWLPEKRVLFSGDHFYKSWPNLYAIRGTMYRDVQAWANAVDMMFQEKAVALVGGHTRPIVGADEVAEALENYRDAIRFVFDKTIEGMNKGLTPDELVDYVELPKELAEKDYLREYYGNIEWAVRSIFNGYLGWFDGNPTNLFSLSPVEEAQRMADLAGGEAALLARAESALESGDAQWAAQLSDHLIALSPNAAAPKLLKARALTALADELLTATGRNYYLTVAQNLRAEAGL